MPSYVDQYNKPLRPILREPRIRSFNGLGFKNALETSRMTGPIVDQFGRTIAPTPLVEPSIRTAQIVGDTAINAPAPGITPGPGVNAAATQRAASAGANAATRAAAATEGAAAQAGRAAAAEGAAATASKGVGRFATGLKVGGKPLGLAAVADLSFRLGRMGEAAINSINQIPTGGQPLLSNDDDDNGLVVRAPGIKGFFGAVRVVSKDELARLANEGRAEELSELYQSALDTKSRAGFVDRYKAEREKQLAEGGVYKWVGNRLVQVARGGEPGFNEVVAERARLADRDAGRAAEAPSATEPQVVRPGVTTQQLPPAEPQPEGAPPRDADTELQQRINKFRETDTGLLPGQMRAVRPDGTVVTVQGTPPAPGTRDNTTFGAVAQRQLAADQSPSIQFVQPQTPDPFAPYRQLVGADVPIRSLRDVSTALGRNGNLAREKFMKTVQATQDAQRNRESAENLERIRGQATVGTAQATAQGAIAAAKNTARGNVVSSTIEATQKEREAQRQQEQDDVDEAMKLATKKDGTIDSRIYNQEIQRKRNERAAQQQEQRFQSAIQNMTREQAQAIVARIDALPEDQRAAQQQSRAYRRALELVGAAG